MLIGIASYVSPETAPRTTITKAIWQDARKQNIFRKLKPRYILTLTAVKQHSVRVEPMPEPMLIQYTELQTQFASILTPSIS